MREFLNKFSHKNRKISRETAEEWFRIFKHLIDIAYTSLGERAFRAGRTLNPAIYEAVMLGLHHRWKSGLTCEKKDIMQLYAMLLENEDFKDTYLVFSTSEEHVEKRKIIAIKTFSRD